MQFEVREEESRAGDAICEYKLLVLIGKPEVNMSIARSNSRLEDNIKMNLKIVCKNVGWKDLTQDTIYWRVIINKK
jgi:hypothetical protein